MFADFVRKRLQNHERLLRFVQNVRWVTKGASEACPLVYNCRDWTQNKYIRTLLKVIVFPFYVFRYFVHRDVPGRKGLAFVLIAKNEAPYIEEWLNFHHKNGVSHFFIYDNDSTDNFREVLTPYIDSGLVTYKLLPGRRRQSDSYNMALHDHWRECKYMAAIDADEFVLVRNTADGGGGHVNLYEFVDEFMTSHPNAGGLGVHWCMFGANGHTTKPEGGVLENFTMSARKDKDIIWHHVIKTIFDPAKALSYISPHFPLYRRGFHNLNENGSIIYGARIKPVHFDKIRINHYYTKSREEYIARCKKGKADGAPSPSADNFQRCDYSEVVDTEILSRA